MMSKINECQFNFVYLYIEFNACRYITPMINTNKQINKQTNKQTSNNIDCPQSLMSFF